MSGKHLIPTFMEAQNIPDAQFKLLKLIFITNKGIADVLPEWGGRTDQIRREFDCLFLHILHPEQRPLVEPPPDGCGSVTTMDKIEEYAHSQLLLPGNPLGFKYTYGTYICAQIDHMIDAFKTYGFGHVKSAMTTSIPEDWDAGKSMPCLRVIDFKPLFDEEDQTWYNHMFLYFRVNDGYSAFNENIGGLQLVNEWFVNQVGSHPKTGLPFKTGEIIYVSKSWNVREEVFGPAKARVYLP